MIGNQELMEEWLSFYHVPGILIGAWNTQMIKMKILACLRVYIPVGDTVHKVITGCDQCPVGSDGEWHRRVWFKAVREGLSEEVTLRLEIWKTGKSLRRNPWRTKADVKVLIQRRAWCGLEIEVACDWSRLSKERGRKMRLERKA